MESIGEKIRKVREEKGYSLDQVARDTHITRRFLEALEQENFSVLPGESYVVGFLRSYAEYLGLNAEETVLLYRNMKLQEQPAPMNELLEKPRISLATIIALVVVAAVVVTAGIFLILSGSETSTKTMETQASEAPTPDPKVVTADILERSFSSGETVRIPIDGLETDMMVNAKDDLVSLTVAGTAISLPLQKESLLDINQDGRADLKVFVRDIDKKSIPNKVIIRFDRVVQSPQNSGPVPNASASATPIQASGLPLGTSNQPVRIKQAMPMAEYTDQQAINLTIRFDAPTTFRYETDTGKKDERQSSNGESIVLTGTNNIRIWSTNGGKTNFKIGAREIKAGNDGEIVAWSLQWITAANGSRQLSLVPMY